ncbi:MAG: hypothetical protein A2599_03800 [Candidatus Staskawiczbacteria bacterium RIFOXYD1_FULL_39_28]|uniref:Glycosyltransferase 2-like domain-containing protein n=1 Tax=Candidatus Staskawiczbacteria bacterium RIFOXYC1_FULL_38_18 TaxID=1802229 RepID=A0A1G2JCV4_9BACT|nr:MAG: hypothetical protein A2401_03715 [Candidatus Staskawiczbacteria bacterium RIFOXYC1_FULL_38_18]OGZ91376.1 MAG: hypothetical protein A2599_03800 [Candidatus Staskawiczbacteria bacterium RIFOXYD1_FULL_39_28]
MKKSIKKIVAIVPALNEEASVGNVLEVLLKSKYFDEVILVDDGSADKTAEIGKSMGAGVIKLPENRGKGNAMLLGAKSTDAEIVVFFDADLVGLSPEHISLLVEPMLSEDIEMCVGIRERAIDTAKLGPLMALGGERAIRRVLLEKIPEKMMQGYAVETSINYYFLKNKLRVKYVHLKGLSIITKEKKWGFLRGFCNRVGMVWQIIKIRIILKLYKNEFTDV